jgi:hypothetical protein
MLYALVSKITVNVSFETADNQSPKRFSSCLMLVIRYHLNSYCNMLLPYLTAFTVQSFLEMPTTSFPAVRKSKVYALFKSQTACLLYIEIKCILANMSILLPLTSYHTNIP